MKNWLRPMVETWKCRHTNLFEQHFKTYSDCLQKDNLSLCIGFWLLGPSASTIITLYSKFLGMPHKLWSLLYLILCVCIYWSSVSPMSPSLQNKTSHTDVLEFNLEMHAADQRLRAGTGSILGTCFGKAILWCIHMSIWLYVCVFWVCACASMPVVTKMSASVLSVVVDRGSNPVGFSTSESQVLCNH